MAFYAVYGGDDINLASNSNTVTEQIKSGSARYIQGSPQLHIRRTMAFNPPLSKENNEPVAWTFSTNRAPVGRVH